MPPEESRQRNRNDYCGDDDAKWSAVAHFSSMRFCQAGSSCKCQLNEHHAFLRGIRLQCGLDRLLWSCFRIVYRLKRKKRFDRCDRSTRCTRYIAALDLERQECCGDVGGCTEPHLVHDQPRNTQRSLCAAARYGLHSRLWIYRHGEQLFF